MEADGILSELLGEPAPCPSCNLPGQRIGYLDATTLYRCSQCNTEYSAPAKYDPSHGRGSLHGYKDLPNGRRFFFLRCHRCHCELPPDTKVWFKGQDKGGDFPTWCLPCGKKKPRAARLKLCVGYIRKQNGLPRSDRELWNSLDNEMPDYKAFGI